MGDWSKSGLLHSFPNGLLWNTNLIVCYFCNTHQTFQFCFLHKKLDLQNGDDHVCTILHSFLNQLKSYLNYKCFQISSLDVRLMEKMATFSSLCGSWNQRSEAAQSHIFFFSFFFCFKAYFTFVHLVLSIKDIQIVSR